MPRNSGAMKLKKFMVQGKFGPYVEPLNNIEIFRHCANGPDCSLSGFEKTVRPLLMAHGVDEIRIV